jgi:myosin heavy subunit
MEQNYQNPQVREWANQDYSAPRDISDEEGLKFDDLKQSILEKDSQLLKVRSKSENILKQYKDAQEELEQCHEQIARQASIIHEQSYKLEQVNARLNDMSHNQSHLINKSKVNVSSFQNELEQRDEEVFKLRELLSQRDEKIRSFGGELDNEKDRIEEYVRECKYKDEEIERLKRKCEQHEGKIDDIMINKRGDSTQLLELDQLKEDKNRLLRLLKSSKEYKDFAEFADDNGGHYRYLQAEDASIPKKKRGTGVKQQHSIEKFDSDLEKQSWIPEEAYQLAHEVRFQTSGEITPKLMNKLLISLNKIWSIRDKQNESRIKSKYISEIERLKRERNMGGQYESVTTKKALARTRAQLKKAEESLREYSAKLKKTKNLPNGISIIDEALMIGKHSFLYNFKM